MLTGSGTYISNHWRQHHIGLGIDLLSGDSDPAGGDYKIFKRDGGDKGRR